jgi:BlaI family penicillinase repressor
VSPTRIEPPQGERRLPEPTNAELEILQALWQRQGSTVRDLYEVLNARHPTGYTTVLKLLQIMLQKGLVRRDSSARSHVYSSTLSEEQTQAQLVGRLSQRAFGGSALRLAMRALAAERVTPDELEKVRQFLDRIEGDKR